eukprot:355796-Chlamydomonas_euryale.AAC.2
MVGIFDLDGWHRWTMCPMNHGSRGNSEKKPRESWLPWKEGSADGYSGKGRANRQRGAEMAPMRCCDQLRGSFN